MGFVYRRYGEVKDDTEPNLAEKLADCLMFLIAYELRLSACQDALDADKTKYEPWARFLRRRAKKKWNNSLKIDDSHGEWGE